MYAACSVGDPVPSQVCLSAGSGAKTTKYAFDLELALSGRYDNTLLYLN